jgi:predicted ferric reductase
MDGAKVSSHVELSRLLAEHGVFGLIFFIYLINLGVKLWGNIKIDSWKLILFLLYLIALLTSFHSAMRTFVSPLLFALSSIGMYNFRKNGTNSIIHRSN